VIEAGGTTYRLTDETGLPTLNGGTLNTTLPWGGVLRIVLKANNISASSGYDPLVPYLLEISLPPAGSNTYEITSEGSGTPNIIYAPLVPSVVDNTTIAVCSVTIPIVCKTPVDLEPIVDIRFKAYAPTEWYGNSVAVNCQNGYQLGYWFDVDNYIYFEDKQA
jgi:hypothetical protein